MPVTSTSPAAKASTTSDGVVAIGTNCELWNTSVISRRARGDGHQQPGGSSRGREQHSLRKRFPHDPPARCPERQAHGRLRPAGDRPGQQKVRDIRARHDQDETADGEQDPQAGSVLIPHRQARETDARAGRNHPDRLVGELANDVRHPVGRVVGLVLDPAAQDPGQARSHARDRGIVAETTDREQPRRNRLPQQRAVAGDQRLLLQGDPQVRRVRANRFAEESRRRHAGLP